MKQKKEILGLNQARAEFDAEMGLEERFELLTKSELQRVKGGVCTTYISSSSSDSPTKPCQCQFDGGCRCEADWQDGCNFGCMFDGWEGCYCNYDQCGLMWT